MPIGGVDDATILVRGAQKVAIASPTIDSPLQLKLFFAHYVSVDGKAVPDALLPWDGSSARPRDQPAALASGDRALGTAPGTYSGSVDVVADGTPSRSDRGHGRARDAAAAEPGLREPATAFNFAPQSYGAKVASSTAYPETSLPGLFSFFASYRLSPNNWGYGNPARRRATRATGVGG